MHCFYYKKSEPTNELLSINGMCIKEKLTRYVNHKRGTNDFLLVYFYDEATIEINGEKKLYPPQTVMIWEDKAPHFYGVNNRSWTHTWINFCGTFVQQFLQQNNFIVGTPFALINSSPIENAIFRLFAEIKYAINANEKIIINHFETMLLEIVREFSRAENYYIPQNIINAKEYIDSHISENLSIKKLSQMACLSTSHFCAEFRKYFDMYPGTYQIKMKMDTAKFLLLNRDMQIQEIAELIGYNDKFQFSKMFKKQIGLSPREYRYKLGKSKF